MPFNLINKKGVLIKMPNYNLDDKIKDKQIIDDYAKELSIFEAAGRERRKKEVVDKNKDSIGVREMNFKPDTLKEYRDSNHWYSCCLVS